MAWIRLIRHGETIGNREFRYNGMTNDPLLPESVEALKKKPQEDFDVIYCSPLLRCRQTAETLFPGRELAIVEDLHECDFGHFEGKNAEELEGDPEYIAFLESAPNYTFPGGETSDGFDARCGSALEQVLDDMETKKIDRAAVVTHGGVIMSLLSSFGRPEKGFYDWYVKNGEGYLCRVDPSVRPPLLEVMDDPDAADEFPFFQGDR